MNELDKMGKELTMRIFIPGENLKKLDKIKDYLNSLEDVQCGMADPWTKKAVYELLFNDAIEKFKMEE